MANTFELIASSTVGAGGASNITFSSIPSTFTDLCLKFSLRDNGPYPIDNVQLTFNNSTTTYSGRRLYGTGSGTGSTTVGYTIMALTNAGGSTSNTFANGEIYVPNYAGSTNKSFSSDSVSENNATEAWQYMIAGLWATTSAITSIKLAPDNAGSVFSQYSNAYLYGVKNA